MIDLHIHSACSIDATDSPESILVHGKTMGIQAISLTEHNNLASLAVAREKAAELGIEYINGVEVGGSIEIDDGLFNIHITGYLFDDAPSAIKCLNDQSARRSALHTQAFLAGLRELGIPVTEELVKELYPDRVSSWAIRRILREKSFAADKPEAEDIQQKALAAAVRLDPGFRSSAPVRAETVLRALKQDHAITFMAHPFWLTKPSRGGFGESVIWKQIEKMIDLGVDGIEAYNTGNDAGYGDTLLAYCQAEMLPASGGSDSHGKSLVGVNSIDYDLLQSIKNFAAGKLPWL